MGGSGGRGRGGDGGKAENIATQPSLAGAWAELGNTRQYYFPNISATKAPIFMKFETQLQTTINWDSSFWTKVFFA